MISKTVSDFNADKSKYSGGGDNLPDDLDPGLVKSWLIQESGGNDKGSLAAWAVDPAQVNVPGDWDQHKSSIGLSKPPTRNTGTLAGNLKAAVMWLTRKGYGRSGQPMSNRPSGTFDGWQTALQRYNGRGEIRSNGQRYRDNYAQRVIERFQNPNIRHPIQLP